MKSLLVYQKFFCLVALLVFEKIFTLEVTQVIIQCYNNNAKFILNENKHSIIMRWLTKQNFDIKWWFLKNPLGQIIALISKIIVSSIAIIASLILSEIPIQGLYF